MCGIAGIIRLSDRPLPSTEVVPRMISRLVHRGPDEWGEYRDEWVHFSAVRLAVMDVANGRQPAITPSGNTVAVYNGETYNYRSLSKDLKDAGHNIANESDTIVIPHMYEQYGLDFIQKLRGMFAFALWDKIQKKVVLCRDRLGIKPFFYAKTNDFFIFGSEIKAILASGLVDPEIDRDSLDDLFSMSYPCPPRTMFKNIYELLPANFFTINVTQGEVVGKRYWEIPFAANGEHCKLSMKDAAQEYQSRLKSAVSDHLMSDVGVGTYLSGGIDSSAITTFAQKAIKNPLDCFTVTFSEEYYSEEVQAKRVADTLGAQHHIVHCGANLSESFSKMIYHTELPLQYPVGLPLLHLSEAVNKAGHKVILTGEGADEQLAGYDCFRIEKINRLASGLGSDFLKSILYKKIFRWMGSPLGIDQFLIQSQKVPSRAVEKAYSGAKPPWYDVWCALDIQRDALLGLDGRKVRAIKDAPREFAALLPKHLDQMHPFDATLAVEMKTRLPSWGMVIEDRISMANGIETRVPFLDHELVEWVAKLPPSYKLNGFTEKAVLKNAMKGVLPEFVTKRKKQAFYSPISEWFFSANAPTFARELMTKQSIAQSNLFNPDVVNSLQQQLAQTPHNDFMRYRLEWILILVLGTEILHNLFIKNISALTAANWQESLAGLRHTKHVA